MAQFLGERSAERAVTASQLRMASMTGVTLVEAQWKSRDWITATIEGSTGERLTYVWSVVAQAPGKSAYFKRPGRFGKKLDDYSGRHLLGCGPKSSRLIPVKIS